MQTGIKYLPESLAEPAALAASYARSLPSLTLIITCGDQDVRLPLLSRHIIVCILNANDTCTGAGAVAAAALCPPFAGAKNPKPLLLFPVSTLNHLQVSSAMRDAGFVDDVLRICLVSTHVDGDAGGDGGWSHVTCRGARADAATMEEVASEPLLVPMAPPHAAASLLFQLQGDMWWLWQWC